MAEPRGREGEAVEVKSARGMSPPAGGGYRGPPPELFLKKWCHLVHSEIFLGAFLNVLKHHVYGAGKSFFTAPTLHYLTLLEAFFFFKTSCLWGGEIMSPPPPKKKRKKKKKEKKRR